MLYIIHYTLHVIHYIEIDTYYILAKSSTLANFKMEGSEEEPEGQEKRLRSLTLTAPPPLLNAEFTEDDLLDFERSLTLWVHFGHQGPTGPMGPNNKHKFWGHGPRPIGTIGQGLLIFSFLFGSHSDRMRQFLVFVIILASRMRIAFLLYNIGS